MSNVLNYFEQPANIDNDNKFHVEGTIYFNGVSFTPEKLSNVLVSNDVTEYSANGEINISGIAIIYGGTGLAGLTLAAPSPGCYCEINLASITSGAVVVTTAAGVTFDGINNTATFDASGDFLRLGFCESIKWLIIENNGVVLSSV